MRSALGCGSLFLLLACSGAPTPDAGVTTTTSYLRDIQPIVERSCAGCHRGGGIGPFALDTPEAAVPQAQRMWDAIDHARMPPFFASTDCNTYTGDERLSDDEKALFKKWVDELAPMGNAADAKHAEAPSVPTVRHDVTMDFGGTYDVRGDSNQTDNYRCFVLDPKNTVDQLVVGYEMMPDNIAVLHHMLAYAVTADKVAELQALDDAAPGLGYPCTQGGVGVKGAIQAQIAGWVPGQSASRLPAGTGLLLKAGGRVIMQLHYFTAAATAGTAPTGDATKLAFEFAPAGSLTQAQIFPTLNYALNIPAYEKQSVQMGELPASLITGTTATLYAAMGHMHQLGTEVRTEIVHKDGTTQCVLDIKGWNFNWQRTYSFKTPITMRTGDKFRITCTYDNSQEHQPYVNGVQQSPRPVTWGESSLDEMCMTYLTFTR
jgi:Copper type II ascorbate-dependent monooxygenase, C-terminal domain